jgi:hypothetical protein
MCPGRPDRKKGVDRFFFVCRYRNVNGNVTKSFLRVFAQRNAGTERWGAKASRGMEVEFCRSRRVGVFGVLLVFITCPTLFSITLFGDTFTAQVEILGFDENGRRMQQSSTTIRGAIFPDGFYVISDEIHPVTKKPLEQCARVNDILYNLQYHPDKVDAYRATLEEGLAPRFLSKAIQCVVLCLSGNRDLEALERGDKHVVLTLGQPIPEYYNTYVVDRSRMPDAWRLVAKAPNFAIGPKGPVTLPPPYEDGFIFWTLDVETIENIPGKAVFIRFLPSDDAVKARRAGKTPVPLEIKDFVVEMSFSWSRSAFPLGRLPSPPRLPFSVEDHRRIFDFYTNNRVSLQVEGAPIVICTNSQWAISEVTASRAAIHVERGLRERDLAAGFWRRVVLIGMLLVSAFCGVLIIRTIGHRTK